MQRLLDDFFEMTEIEIESVKDAINADPDGCAAMGSSYVMAINRCRRILEVILKDKQK